MRSATGCRLTNQMAIPDFSATTTATYPAVTGIDAFIKPALVPQFGV
jgi:hypothetical protein